jgi:hypothetical protein
MQWSAYYVALFGAFLYTSCTIGMQSYRSHNYLDPAGASSPSLSSPISPTSDHVLDCQITGENSEAQKKRSSKKKLRENGLLENGLLENGLLENGLLEKRLPSRGARKQLGKMEVPKKPRSPVVREQCVTWRNPLKGQLFH